MPYNLNALNINKGFVAAPSTIYFCKVLSFNVLSGTADVSSIDNNISMYGCKILCSIPSGFNFGVKYIPTFEGDVETSYVMSPGDLYCAAGYLSGDHLNPIIFGFIYPHQNELSIPEFGLYIFRHESDIVMMIRADGTMELYHPSGSYIKFGTDDIDYVSSDVSEGGLYPSSVKDLNLRDTDEFNTKNPMGMFIRFWAGQKLTFNKDGEANLEVGKTNLVIKPDGTVNLSATQINLMKVI